MLENVGRMPHESLLLRNDYDRKIDYDWPY